MLPLVDELSRQTKGHCATESRKAVPGGGWHYQPGAEVTTACVDSCVLALVSLGPLLACPRCPSSTSLDITMSPGVLAVSGH